MKCTEVLVKYLKEHAPPGAFKLLGLGDDTTYVCQGLCEELGAIWTVLGSAYNTSGFPTVDEIRHHGEQTRYDVVLVPAVLHKHKNWYEYLEAIINVADIAIVEAPAIPGPRGKELGGPALAHARGLVAELAKTGEQLSRDLWAINRKLIRGEAEQSAMIEEILRGFNANVQPEYFRVSEEALEGISGAMVEALKYHGYRLVYDPAITAANLNQIVVANPVPEVVPDYKPEPLTKKGWLGDGGPLCGQASWDD